MDMKFANYKYHGQNINNLGDHAQVLTIDYLYEEMGIGKEDIIYIDINNLQNYDGPPVKLPVSLPLINYTENGIAGMFSKNIQPVFFGLTMPKTTLLPEEIKYYKKYEPIGCRDEQAYNTLRKYGINAYLGGCLTVTLPKRDINMQKQKKIFIIDPPKNLKAYIPKEILNNAIIDTHIFYNHIENPTEEAAKRYQLYKNEAKLMITGLLHASIPCLAFGIPVILARDFVSYRFAWVEALLKIYTTSEYNQIDWNPPIIEFERLKELVKKVFIKKMKGEDASEEILYLHNFYMNRERKTYCNDVFLTIQNFINNNWTDKDKHYQYAVWGLTQMAQMTVDYISNNYPNAKLTHVYDKNTSKTLNGIQAILPDNIENYPKETVFVTTVSAADEAEEYFKKIKKEPLFYNTLKIIR